MFCNFSRCMQHPFYNFHCSLFAVIISFRVIIPIQMTSSLLCFLWILFFSFFLFFNYFIECWLFFFLVLWILGKLKFYNMLRQSVLIFFFFNLFLSQLKLAWDRSNAESIQNYKKVLIPALESQLTAVSVEPQNVFDCWLLSPLLCLRSKSHFHVVDYRIGCQCIFGARKFLKVNLNSNDFSRS